MDYKKKAIDTLFGISIAFGAAKLIETTWNWGEKKARQFQEYRKRKHLEKLRSQNFSFRKKGDTEELD